MKDYDVSEIRPILDSYDRPTLEISRDVLWRAVSSAEEWDRTLDTKAQVMIAFASAVVTVILPLVLGDPTAGGAREMALAALVGGFEVTAIAWGFLCLMASGWPSPTDSSLLPAPSGQGSDGALRFWNQMAFMMHQRVRDRLRTKGRYLQMSQVALVGGVLVLAVVAVTDYSDFTMSSSNSGVSSNVGRCGAGGAGSGSGG